MLTLIMLGFAVLAAVFIVAVIVLGVCLSPDKEEFNATCHPFKSESAKTEFLKQYDAIAEKWPIASSTKSIETSYGKTFVRISGPDNAPPMVLLHGIGGNSLQWIPNVEALSEKYRTYAIDNIYDNGRSVYSRPVRSADDFVSWLDELFSALAIGKDVCVVGLSYGGWIASQFALNHPDRISKMVLLAPVCTVLPLSPQWIGRAVLCALPNKYFTKKFMYWLMDDLAQTGAAGQSTIEAFIHESYLAIRSFKTKRMVNPTVLTDEELQSIKVPVLYLVGEHEKIYPPGKAIDRIRSIAPRIETVLISGAGHDLTAVQADMVNRLILDF